MPRPARTRNYRRKTRVQPCRIESGIRSRPDIPHPYPVAAGRHRPLRKEGFSGTARRLRDPEPARRADEIPLPEILRAPVTLRAAVFCGGGLPIFSAG